MSTLLEIQEMLQDTNATLARLDEALVADSSSAALQATGRSLQKRQQSLESQFAASAADQGIDVFTYRLFGSNGNPSILSLATALVDFQTLITVVYDAIKSSVPKIRTRVSAESRLETALNFGYSYPGSVGLVLTIPNERLLIGESNLDKAVEAIFALAKATEPSKILEFAKQLGPASIGAMYKWALDLDQSGLGADIQWRRGQSVRAHLMAQRPELEQLHQVIGHTSDETIEELLVDGLLMGADVNSKSFHIQIESGEHIRGSFIDAISPSQTVELPKRYRASIRRTVTFRYSTEQEKISYHLLRLDTPA